jgi:type IV pilus assembly protein PilO
MNLSDIDLNDLDFSNVGNWPTSIRLFTVAIVLLAVLGLGYWFDLKDQQLRLEQVEKKEAELKVSFEDKAAKAANLEAYEQQLEEMRHHAPSAP